MASEVTPEHPGINRAIADDSLLKTKQVKELVDDKPRLLEANVDCSVKDALAMMSNGKSIIGEMEKK